MKKEYSFRISDKEEMKIQIELSKLRIQKYEEIFPHYSQLTKQKEIAQTLEFWELTRDIIRVLCSKGVIKIC